ncbi:MAG: aminopeptidase N [Pseudohongiellaceae bacterium]|jgi:aminopeptidase N
MHLTYFSHHWLYTGLCTSRMFKLLIPALLMTFLCSCTEDRNNKLLVTGAGDTGADIVTTEVTALEIEQGVSWQLAEHRSQTLSGLRYSYKLTIPDSINSPITGILTVSFDWNDESAQPIVLDFLSPMERVKTLSVNSIETNWLASSDHIVIAPSAFSSGLNSIELEFDVGDEAFNRSSDFLYALFVPDRAHYSLPLFDQPNLKGRVTWEVTAPENWRVVANGPQETTTQLDGQTRFQFSETEPMPSYLFAIAAGKFEIETAVINGREFNMFHRETDALKVTRNKDEVFKLHADTLAWLEQYTQIDYPFKKFDFVLIPSFQYGGMEHPGGILYRAASVFLDETATQRQILGRASLIAHETAHMWFGDLVTMNWFDDVWTKEVFANFMAAKIVNPAFPEVDHELRFLTAHHPSAYAVDRTEGANQIRQPLENLRFAGTLYGAIIYQKAPIVMRHLENRIGEEAFREGMREYLATYSYGNASWPDLIAILDKLTPEDLSSWSQVWVSEAGRPNIMVQRQGDDVLISQQDPQAQGRIWPQTLNVRAGSLSASKNFTIELGEQPQRLIGAGKADFILPNGSGLEYGNFLLDERSRNHLITNVSQLEPALLRGAAWVTLWDQLLAGYLAPSVFTDSLLNALPIEQNELIVDRLLGYLGRIYWNYGGAEERGNLAPQIEVLLWSQVNSDRSRSARSAFYASYRQLALSEEGTARLERLWLGEESVEGLPLSETDQIALASGLALRGLSNAEDILDQQRQRIQNPDRLARFDFVRPALSSNLASRKAFFEFLAQAENRNREAWVLNGLQYLHHPLRVADSIEFIQPALELLTEIQATGDIFFPSRWLDVNLGGHNSIEAADIVTAFLNDSESLSPRLRLKVLQSSDRLFRSAGLVYGWTPNRAR